MNAKTTRNVREKAEKVEKTIRKVTPLTKIVLISLGLLGGLYCADKAYTKMSEWRNDHKIIRQKVINVKFELKLQWPYRVEEVKESSQSAKIHSPVALQGQVLAKEVSPQPNLFEKAYDYVWMRESNRGKDVTGLNGYCISRGMINEIGYAPHENYCFKDQEEQHQMFILWLNNRLNHVKMPYCNDIDGCLRVYSNGAYGFEIEK